MKTKGRGLVLYKNSYNHSVQASIAQRTGTWISGADRIEKAVVSQLPSDKEDSLLQMQKQTLKKYVLESNPI